MVVITPEQPPELSGPSLPQAIKFFTPSQKKILIVSSVVFVAVAVSSGFGFYYWLTAFKKSQVDFNISGPSQVSSGESANYTVSYWNNTKQVLENAVLTVRFPQDAMVSDGKTNKSFNLGNIGVGGGGKQEVAVAFIGSDKSIEKIDAVLSYKPQNNSSSFENTITQEAAISGSALSIDLKTPDAILSNIRSVYVVNYKNNTDKVFENVSVEMNYPGEFNFVTSDKSPSEGNNVWNLGDLNPGEEGKINITGVLKNAQNVSFNVAIGVDEGGRFYKFLENSIQANLTSLPLKLDVSVNGESSIIANAGDSLRFKLKYENSAGLALTDVVLKTKLDGLMFDFASLRTDGNFNSMDNSITWNASNVAAFRSLKSGESGEVEFDVSVKSRYVVRTFRDKNFTLQVSSTLETPTVPPSLSVKTLSAANDLSVKVNTKAEFKSKGYYSDSTFRNSGPLPPKANQATSYTFHWQITNYSNDLENVVIKSILPEGVRWLNNKTGDGAAGLEYNERTSEIAWNVGKLAAGTGVLLKAHEVVFQLSLTPPVNQVGNTVPVLGQANLTGKDSFTGSDISALAPEVKTDMPDDSSVGILKSKVQP